MKAITVSDHILSVNDSNVDTQRMVWTLRNVGVQRSDVIVLVIGRGAPLREFSNCRDASTQCTSPVTLSAQVDAGRLAGAAGMASSGSATLFQL